MKTISIMEITKAVNGRLISGFGLENTSVCGVVTDSRVELKDCLFVPLVGEVFDAHDFIETAFDKGAACTLTEKDISIKTGKPVILVESTYAALKQLAEYYRVMFDVPVVGITGSSGKTTTKDMVFSVISQKLNSIKNYGNLNNEIGLPLTVFNIEPSTECAVLEMGMNHFGELHNLSKIAKPYICVITNIGVAHIEYLGSREGILKAKSEIFDFMQEDGIAVLNGEDDMLITLKDKLKNVIYYGTDDSCQIYATNIRQEDLTGISCTINYKNISFDVKIPSPGKHMVMNALAAAAVGLSLGLTKEQIKTGIEVFTPSKMRSEILENHKLDITIINDAYNANPESMKAAINVLVDAPAKGRRVCILGDMLELGEQTDGMHYELGKFIADKGINCVICVGKNKYTYNSVHEKYSVSDGKDLSCYYFETKEQLAEKLGGIIKRGDTVLVKGSRLARLEMIASALSGLDNIEGVK